MGISLLESSFTEEGLQFDRKWMIVDLEKNKHLSPRDNRGIKLARVKPSFDFERGMLDVSFPDDPSVPSFSMPLDPPAEEVFGWEEVEGVNLWGNNLSGRVVPSSTPGAPDPSVVLSNLTGHHVKLVMKPPAHLRPVPFATIDAAGLDYEGGPRTVFADVGPFMIASTASVVDAQRRIGEAQKAGAIEWDINREVSIDRWRPNLVVEGVETPFGEDDWIEGQVGDKQYSLLFPGRVPRCIFPNVDPATGVRDSQVPHKVLMGYRRVVPQPGLYYFGYVLSTLLRSDPATYRYMVSYRVYGVPVSAAGVLRVGDRIKITKHAPNPLRQGS
ncbi:uncharacterized protein EI90DRAFT_3125135 [Cantharellus anzutake]|uniref:uncharacterized protein n=1 Tax=Cantharellus anzutake TaxID=1750568 RepID=UPI001907139C|nr:uncharacterized protein EI90DRAFT_3125135 [Cantharellus anzutake]KAF8329343.1 hypothetical protein EI90DRAFT_3125135 [Cantharellus anzutake]